MSTAAAIALVLAALFLGVLIPVLWQLKVTLTEARNTLLAAQTTLAQIDLLAPSAHAAVNNAALLVGDIAAGGRTQPDGTLAVLSQMIPVAIRVFRAWNEELPQQPESLATKQERSES